MSLKHIIKHTESEIVFKCYVTDSAGGSVDLSLENDMTKPTEVYTAPTSVPDETGGGFVEYTGSRVFITGIWWGLKKDKQLDITRIINPTGPVLHGHYYLIGAGAYEYGDFSDRVYANKDIRLIFDGPGHCILKLRKAGWTSKLETAQFSVYDDVNAVGS
jgi:hypothetical protein